MLDHRQRAVFHRDKRGTEPVDELIDAPPDKRAAKIDDFIQEHLSNRPPDAPPPDFPISSEAYREARDEYAAIRKLRKKNWIAAHIRERRSELDLTQKDVAERAGTSHSFVPSWSEAITSRRSRSSSASSPCSTRSC